MENSKMVLNGPIISHCPVRVLFNTLLYHVLEFKEIKFILKKKRLRYVVEKIKFHQWILVDRCNMESLKHFIYFFFLENLSHL